MSTFTGTAALVRLALRRDRVMLPVWIAVFVLMAAVSATATVGLYPSAAGRLQAADAINGASALVAIYGKIYDPTSLGAIAMIKMAGLGSLMVAVLAIILVIRHTRGEEEAGRLELVGAGVVGRHAALTAALAVAVAANLGLGLLTSAALAATGLPTSGSLAFGLAWAGTGLAFAGIAAVAAQLTQGARAATGLALAVLAAVYLLRAVGDTARPGGPTWATWLSPIGWGQQVRAFARERWWVLVLLIGFAALAAAAAYALASGRDLAAGLLPTRRGRAHAPSGLGSALGLAWRLQRGTFAGWLAGFVLLGGVLGSISTNLPGLTDSQQARDMFTKLGGQQGLTNAFLATEMGFAGIIASAYGIQAAMRLRGEEEAGRVDPLLAAGTGRVGWVLGHVVVALLGSGVLLLAAGVVGGAGYAAQSGDSGAFIRLVGAALVQVPAVWVLTGVVVATFGLAPRATAAGWAALVVFLLIGELGPLLNLDQWLMDLSPFAHTPRLPGGAFSVGPVVGLLAVAAALMAAGVAGARRRDLR